MERFLVVTLSMLYYNTGHQHPPRLSLKRIFGGFFYV